MDIQKVIIVDDQNVFSKGLEQLLASNDNIEIVKIVANSNNVMEVLKDHSCDTLLLDLNMPHKNGFEVLKEIRDVFPNLNIAILSTFIQSTFVEKAKKLGANAYLSKDAEIYEIIEVILGMHNSSFYVSEEINYKSKQPEFIQNDFIQHALLTPREKEILKLIGSGKSSKKIANKFNISPYTVRTHRKNLMAKLNINNISELIKYAYENKII